MGRRPRTASSAITWRRAAHARSTRGVVTVATTARASNTIGNQSPRRYRSPTASKANTQANGRNLPASRPAGRATKASAVHGKQNSRREATKRDRSTGANANARATSSHRARSAIRPVLTRSTSRLLTRSARSSMARTSRPSRSLTHTLGWFLPRRPAMGTSTRNTSAASSSVARRAPQRHRTMKSERQPAMVTIASARRPRSRAGARQATISQMIPLTAHAVIRDRSHAHRQLMTADPHLTSTRPCATCRLVLDHPRGDRSASAERPP